MTSPFAHTHLHNVHDTLYVATGQCHRVGAAHKAEVGAMPEAMSVMSSTVTTLFGPFGGNSELACAGEL